MGIRIDALDTDAAATLQHVVPAMKDGKTVKLTVAQINALNAAADHAVTAKAAIVDADERNLLDSADTFKRKKLTMPISSRRYWQAYSTALHDRQRHFHGGIVPSSQCGNCILPEF